jgi:hypothetical protein
MTSQSYLSENANNIIRNNVDHSPHSKTTQLRDAVLLSWRERELRQSQFGRRPETSGHYARSHRPGQGNHRILERLLIDPFLQGEPPFYRKDIPKTCSVPTLS